VRLETYEWDLEVILEKTNTYDANTAVITEGNWLSGTVGHRWRYGDRYRNHTLISATGAFRV
jgi:hypothetical protein